MRIHLNADVFPLELAHNFRPRIYMKSRIDIRSHSGSELLIRMSPSFRAIKDPKYPQISQFARGVKRLSGNIILFFIFSIFCSLCQTTLPLSEREDRPA